MGNRRSREFRLKQEDDALWRRARTEVRLAIDDIHARGIGVRRIQLIRCPSFEPSQAYEVRQGGDEWRLYGSDVVEAWPHLKLTGYDQISIPSELLAAFFSRLTTISLPLAPDGGGGGTDGETYHLAVFSEWFSHWRFQWWSVWPPQWKPIVEIANEMLDIFAKAISNS
jgi:hypothetical protein